jgi:glycosyltransferase involved in cell wall biosynthesis
MILPLFFGTFIACAVIQITYYILFSTFLVGSKKNENNIPEVPVSVIIYTKNQAKNLPQFIPLIMDQENSKFEIVLINNASSDNTSEVLELFAKKYANLKVLNIENNEAFWGSKKYALTLGIKASKYDNLLFTDTKSKPVSKYWVSEMSKKFTSKKTIVLGYRKYQKENSLLNIFIRFENLLTAIKCFGITKLGSPYMAFGTNLAYQKSEFFKVNGFINHMKINAGEGDLFIKDAADRKNTTFCISENSFIKTDSPNSFLKWFTEKKEETLITKKHQFKHRFFLGLFSFSKLLFYVLAATLFFFYPWKIILSVVLSYFLIQYIVIGVSIKKLKEPQIIFFLPFLEIGLLLIQISIFSANLISKPDHWK